MFNIEKEISNVIEDALLDNLLFYGSEYSEYRNKIFKEFKKQSIKLITQVEKELDEADEE